MGLKPLGGQGAVRAWGSQPRPRGFPRRAHRLPASTLPGLRRSPSGAAGLDANGADVLLSQTVCFEHWMAKLPMVHCLAASWQRRCRRWLSNGRIAPRSSTAHWCSRRCSNGKSQAKPCIWRSTPRCSGTGSVSWPSPWSATAGVFHCSGRRLSIPVPASALRFSATIRHAAAYVVHTGH
jgi:hypothetical protein